MTKVQNECTRAVFLALELEYGRFITQREFVKRMNLSYSTFQRWHFGKAGCTIDKLIEVISNFNEQFETELTVDLLLDKGLDLL